MSMRRDFFYLNNDKRNTRSSGNVRGKSATSSLDFHAMSYINSSGSCIIICPPVKMV